MSDFISAQERRRIERSNTWHDIWQQDAEHAARVRREQVSKKKNGAPRFPDANRDSRLTAIRESLAALYDEAVEAKDRDAAMAAPNADTRRFPNALNGGQ